MPIPTILFGVLLAIFWGAIFHFLRGGSTRRLISFLLLSLAGFWIGDTVAYNSSWSFLSVGVLNAGMGSLFSIAFLMVGELLAGLLTAAREK